MEKDQLTFNDLPTVVGELCDRNRKYGKPAYGETFQAVRNQREHAHPHDRTGGLQLS